MPFISRALYGVCLVAVVTGALALRIPYLEQRSIWFDEASSWQASQFSLNELFESLRLNVHVPLYYLILKAWVMMFGDSVFALRGLSVAFGLITVGVAFFLGQEVFLNSSLVIDANAAIRPTFGDYRERREFALVVAALTATSACQVSASIDVKMYSLGTALAGGSAWFALRVLRSPQDLGNWFFFGALNVLFLYTHHYALFSVGANVTFIMLCTLQYWASGRRQQARQLVVPAVIVAVGIVACYLPGSLMLLGQTQRVQQEYWTGPLRVSMVLDTIVGFVLPNYIGSLAEVICILLLFFSTCVLASMPVRRGELLVLMSAILPMMLAGAITWAIVPIWHGRFFRFSQLFWIIIVALAVWKCAAGSLVLRRLVIGLLLLGNASATVAFWTSRDIPHQPGMRGIIEQVRGLYSPEDGILVIDWHHFFPAKYYSRATMRVNLLIPDKHPFWSDYLVRPDDLISPEQLAERAPSTLWIISGRQLRVFERWRVTESWQFRYDNGISHSPIFLYRCSRVGPQAM